jgi:hypothetical protein
LTLFLNILHQQRTYKMCDISNSNSNTTSSSEKKRKQHEYERKSYIGPLFICDNPPKGQLPSGFPKAGATYIKTDCSLCKASFRMISTFIHADHDYMKRETIYSFKCPFCMQKSFIDQHKGFCLSDDIDKTGEIVKDFTYRIIIKDRCNECGYKPEQTEWKYCSQCGKKRD